MAADFGTLTISSDREVIDDSVLYELAEADEPSTLTLRTPDGETGSLTFDGTKYHLQPCGQTNEFTYSVLFSADGENVELSIFVQCLNPQNYAASANGCSRCLL